MEYLTIILNINYTSNFKKKKRKQIILWNYYIISLNLSIFSKTTITKLINLINDKFNTTLQSIFYTCSSTEILIHFDLAINDTFEHSTPSGLFSFPFINDATVQGMTIDSSRRARTRWKNSSSVLYSIKKRNERYDKDGAENIRLERVEAPGKALDRGDTGELQQLLS